MRVLVTGANGFVGRALLQRLLALDGVGAVAGLRNALVEGELPCERRVLGDLAVERFELEHPTLAGTLRNIAQALGNMGI